MAARPHLRIGWGKDGLLAYVISQLSGASGQARCPDDQSLTECRSRKGSDVLLFTASLLSERKSYL